jgi:large subunit ribosomal protein L25
METTTMQAEVRTTCGKGPARRLRKAGKIPAVLYGPGLSPTPLTVPPKDLEKALGSERGRNTVYTLEYDGRSCLAMVRDLAVDPVTRGLLHADFYKVSEDQTVDVHVPFRTSGRAIGMQKGGRLYVLVRTIPVKVPVRSIPTAIEVDVSGLDLDQSVRVRDLPLPEGVVVTLRPDMAVAAVTEPKKLAPEPGEVSAVAATAEGGAAPAAPAA